MSANAIPDGTQYGAPAGAPRMSIEGLRTAPASDNIPAPTTGQGAAGAARGENDLRADAAKLLSEGEVKLVIGYRAQGAERLPVFVSDAAGAQVLVYDPACRQNLAAYLCKPEVRRRMPVALVASPAVCRSLVLLASESQITDADVRVLAVGEKGYRGVLDLAGVAAHLNADYPELAPDKGLLDRVAELSAQTPQERARFWAEQFAKCTRCYACRAACPNCYCQRCIVEKSTPQWVSSAAAGHGNFAWNVIRAFHQAGRCTGCGACEAACPQGLPLMLLNTQLGKEAFAQFGAKPGYDPKAPPLIGTWNASDDDNFLR